MKHIKLTSYITQELYTTILNLWSAKRKQDRKTSMSDIVEAALKDYAIKQRS